MRVPMFVAARSKWEARLVGEFDVVDHGVIVVRRCADASDLLAAAVTGTARAAVVSAGVPGLERDVVTRLRAVGVTAVGVIDPGDAHAEARLRRIGVPTVLSIDAGAAEIARMVIETVAEAVVADDPWFGDPGSPLPDRPVPPPARGRGRVLAVWGPTGAPGRTAVAIGVADEAARLGVSSMLVDADTYGGSVAQTLALAGETAGIEAACRSAAAGQLDTARLARLSRQIRPGLRVLTGLEKAHRWPDVKPSALVEVLEQARHLSALVVVDCGFCLEHDQQYGSARNSAALAVLGAADTVLCVGAADPVGLRRLVHALDELRQAAPGAVPLVVVNRVRATVIPGQPEREIAAALSRWAGLEATAYLPAAPAVLDLAMRTGATVAEAAPVSPLRQAMTRLARTVTGAPEPAPRRRWRLSRSR